jgi:hypothetical protein
MIAEKDCPTCGKHFRKVYAKGRKEPVFCCRLCVDNNQAHQAFKAQQTAATRWPSPKTTEIQCAGCTKTFIADARTARRRKYCTAKCKYKTMAKNQEIAFNCKSCGKPTQSTLRPGRAVPKYCSRRCMGADPVRIAHISKVNKQRMHEPEIRQRTLAGNKAKCQKDSWKESRRKIMLAAYARGSFSEKSLTKPVRLVLAMLDELNVSYHREWVFGPYAFDLYLPDFNACIEVQGDYWHGNPAVYQNPSTKQKRRQNIDKTKLSYAKNRGVRALPLWERDIKASPDECSENIQLLIAASTGFRSKV